jgi:serine/threonine protein kinase
MAYRQVEVMQLATGQQIGQYRIIGRLGTGGMAEIYRAHQENMGRDVAIKILRADISAGAEGTERFKREARTIASLSHPHIIKVFEYDRFHDLFYLVMELMEGGTLADRIQRGPLPLDTINTVLGQIAQALDYIHRNGIVHRDLKPSNILFDRNGYAILTDFGISKRTETLAALTAAGMAMGTLVYMAPEQLHGEPSDKRTDVYALGVVLFEMLTGKLPFDTTTPGEIFQGKMSAAVPSIRKLRPAAPEGAQQVVEKAMAHDPADRYQSATELAVAFDAVFRDAPATRPTSQPVDRPAYAPTMPEQPPLPVDRTIPELPPTSQRTPTDKTLPEGPPPSRPPARTLPEQPAPLVSAPIRTWPDEPVAARGGRGPLLAVAALIVLLALGGIIFMASRGGPANPIPSPTVGQVALATQTPTQAATATTASSPTTAPSATTVPTTATVEATRTPTNTPTPALTATPVPSATIDQTVIAEATRRNAPTQAATQAATPGDFGSALPAVPTDIVELLRFAIRSESLKAENFNCRIYVKVMSNLKDIAANDDKGADDADDLVQSDDAQGVLKYCADPKAPGGDHELPQDVAIPWGNVRLIMISVFAKYAT